MSRYITSTRFVRTYNASTVLQTLYKHGSLTRSQLAKRTGMSAATITRIVTQLLEQGIVLEGQMGKSTGGRRPVYVQIDHSKLYIASLKLLRDNCIAALLDLRGNILQKRHLNSELCSPEQFLHRAAQALLEMFAAEQVNCEHIVGLGVAASGICHPKQGVIIKSVNLGWENVPIAKILTDKLQLPIYLENDANACALAELWLGSAKDSVNYMYIKTEEGAGAGIVSQNALLTGPRFTTGEIGHIPLISDGKRCRCGQRGCLETYVYFGDIQTRFFEKTGKTIDRQQFLQLVESEDPFTLHTVQEAATALAMACAHFGILLDLDRITIGGLWGILETEVVNYCQAYYDNIVQQSGFPCHTVISGSALSDDADLLGAAGLVINNWFDPLSAPFDR